MIGLQDNHLSSEKRYQLAGKYIEIWNLHNHAWLDKIMPYTIPSFTNDLRRRSTNGFLGEFAETITFIFDIQLGIFVDAYLLILLMKYQESGGVKRHSIDCRYVRNVLIYSILRSL